MRFLINLIGMNGLTFDTLEINAADERAARKAAPAKCAEYVEQHDTAEICGFDVVAAPDQAQQVFEFTRD